MAIIEDTYWLVRPFSGALLITIEEENPLSKQATRVNGAGFVPGVANGTYANVTVVVSDGEIVESVTPNAQSF